MAGVGGAGHLFSSHRPLSGSDYGGRKPCCQVARHLGRLPGRWLLLGEAGLGLLRSYWAEELSAPSPGGQRPVRTEDQSPQQSQSPTEKGGGPRVGRVFSGGRRVGTQLILRRGCPRAAW